MFRRLYYDKQTGNIVLDYSFRGGSYTIPTVEQDFNSYTNLKNRAVDTVGYIEFNYGEYEQDFAECNGYRVNPTTLGLEFSYPTEGEQPQEPVYQKPLSVQVAEQQSVIDTLLLDNLNMQIQLDTLIISNL